MLLVRTQLFIVMQQQWCLIVSTCVDKKRNNNYGVFYIVYQGCTIYS